MADEAFHEIQLNGKQLVFLFMAATVVAVVIFLCGVMVGRGVRTQPAGSTADAGVEAASDPTANLQAAPHYDESAPAATATTSDAAPSGEEQLTYPDRLADPTAPQETLTAEAPKSDVPVARKAPVAPEPAAPSATRVPSGDGFTVQVAAVKARSEADTIAQRLARKGYQSYVIAPAAGAPAVFRVRVGKYKERKDAESVAGRLAKEEQFKPWITR